MPYNKDFRSTLDTLQKNSIPSAQILDSLADPGNIDHRDVGDEVKTMRSEGRQDDSILRVITAKASPPVKSQEYPSALRGEFGKLIRLPGEMIRAFGAGAMEMLNIPATGMAMVGAGLAEPYKGIAPSEAGWGREAKANLQLGENLIKTGQRQAQTIGGWQERVAPQITSLDDVKTSADMVIYAGTQFTNLLGTMLPVMAVGGLGGGAAKKTIEKEAFRISQEMLGKGFAPEVVKATVDKQTQRALDKLMFKQALKVEIPMEAEQINVEAVRRGEPPTLAEAALPAVIAGIPGAAGEAPILSRMFPSMRKIGGVPKTFLGKATATTWKTLLEATTESQQTWFERLFSGQGVVGPEADKEIRDTFYGVGLGVLPMSIFGVIPGKRTRNISRLNQLLREDPEFSKQFSEIIKKNPTRYQELKKEGLELETPTTSGTERPVGIPGVPTAKTREGAMDELKKRRPDLAKIMQEVGAEVPAEGVGPAPPPTAPKEPGTPIPPIAPEKEPTRRVTPTLTGMETIPAQEQKPPVVPEVPGVIPEREPEKGTVPGLVPTLPAQEPPAVATYIDNLAGSEEAFARSHAQRLQRGNPETWGYFTPIGQKIEVTPERAEKIKEDIDRLYAEGEVTPPAVTTPPAVPIAEVPENVKPLLDSRVEAYKKLDEEGKKAFESAIPKEYADYIKQKAAAEPGKVGVPVSPKGPVLPIAETPATVKLATEKFAPEEQSKEAKFRDRLKRMIAQRIKLGMMESQGQDILDTMEEQGRSPIDVSRDFWSKTYWQLDGPSQEKFKRQARAMMGVEGKEFNDKVDPIKIADEYTEALPGKVEHLEGVERGYVSLMEWANLKLSATESPIPARPAISEVHPALQPKEPWEMTREEFQTKYPTPEDRLTIAKQYGQSELVTDVHRGFVWDQIKEGKPVPPEVLKDYPDLVPKTMEILPALRAKAPWQMTEREYFASKEKAIGEPLTENEKDLFRGEHQAFINKAIERGLIKEGPKLPIAEPGKVGAVPNRQVIWDAYQALKSETGSSAVDILELQKRSGANLESLKILLKEESAKGNVVLTEGAWTLGEAAVSAEHARASIELSSGRKILDVRIDPSFIKEVPKLPVAERGKAGKPTTEELSQLKSGQGWVEFESEKGTIVQGKINDVFPADKELWVFPSDRSLLGAGEEGFARTVLRVPFDKVTKILETGEKKGEVLPALRQIPEKNIYFSGTPEDRVLLQNEFLRIGQMGKVAARDFFNSLPDAELNELAEANRQPILKDRKKLIDNMVHYSTRAAKNMVHWSMHAARPEESLLITRPTPDASIEAHRRFINAYGLSTLLRLSGIKQSAKIADFMETTFGFGQGTEDPGYKTIRANLISQGLDSRTLGKIEEIYTGITHDHRNAIRSAKNTADLLRVVARFSKNKDAVSLAKAMLASDEVLGYLEAAPVTKYNNTIVREGLEPTTSSFYVGTAHAIFLQMDDLLRTTREYADYLLLHEPIHAATGRKMTESDRKKITGWIGSVEKSLSPGDVKNLENYRKDFKLGAASFGLTTHPENVYYGLVNEDEFLGQAYSSPEFRSFLKNFMVERKGKKTSLWQEFKDWVRSVLNDMGITETKLGLQREQFDNLLDRVLSLGGEIMQRDVEARKYAQRPIENPNHPVHADTVAALGNSWQNSNIGHLVDHHLGKTPKGINVITTESHGPQFFHWFRNMESILSQTKFGRLIYEAARWFKHRTIATYNQWERRYREAVKELDDDEKMVLLWVLDSKRPIPQANHKILDAAQKVRTLLDGVWTYMRDNGLDIGYLENFFPHLFNGTFWVRQNGQDVRMADGLGEALKMAKELLTANGGTVDIEQDTVQAPVDGTPLSRRAFWNLNQALVDEIGKRFPVMQGLTQDDIAGMLINDKIARPLPSKRFFGNMLPRLANNPNFRRNIDEVMRSYLYGAARKVSQDEFKKTVQTNVEAMPPQDADLRRFVEQTYMPLVLAHPSRFENGLARAFSAFYPGLTGQDIRRISHKFNLIQYVWDMGVSFTSAVANASQFWINAQPIVGPVIAAKAYAKAIHSFKDAQLMRELEEVGITEGVSSFSGVPLAHEVWKDVVNKIRFKEGFSGFAEASLAGFNVVEMVNRFSAYWAGKAWAEKQLKSGKSAEEVAKRIAPANSSLVEMGRELDKRKALPSRVQNVRLKLIALQEQFISQWGFELNDKTNFRAGRENLPQILSEAPVRLVSPYKSFILNQLKFTYDTVGIKGWKEHPLTALNFMATSLALGGALANPATAIMVKALSALSLALGGDDLEKELKRKGLWRGLSGLAGFDIAGSVAINAPTLTGPEGGWELVGRFGRSTRDLYKYLFSTETPEIYREKKLVRGIQPAILQRVIDSMEILKTGQYRSPITMTPITLKDPSWDAVKRLFGIMPERVLTEYDLEAEQKKLSAKFGATAEDMRVRFVIAKTPEEQQAVINKFVNEFNKSLDKFKNVQSEDQVMEGMGEILFWSSWIKNNPAMQKMFMRMSVSREITKLMALPTYMRPGAAVEMQKRGLLGATPAR